MKNKCLSITSVYYCLATAFVVVFHGILIAPYSLFLPFIQATSIPAIPSIVTESSSFSVVSDLTKSKSRKLQYDNDGGMRMIAGVGVGEDERNNEDDSSTTRAMEEEEGEDNNDITIGEENDENSTIVLVNNINNDEVVDDGSDEVINNSNSTTTNEVVGDGNGDDNDQCSLCQGVTLLKDHKPEYSLQPKYPNLLMTGIPMDATCSEIEISLRQGQGSQNPSQCRSNAAYNYFFWRCCKASIPRYACEQNIHEQILGGNSNYNSAVPPIASKGGGDNDDDEYGGGPLTVYVQLEYEALETIDVEDGTASIFITLVNTWNDPRLAWTVNNDNGTCASKVTVWSGHEAEETTIWVPDFDLLNQIEGVQTWNDIQARVYSDGTVEWIRAGGIKAFCSFKGLAMIPFDTLGCQFLMGARSRLDKGMINYKLSNEKEVKFGPFNDMTVYNEFRAVPERANAGYTFDGEVIYYDFWFQRAKTHYIQNVVVPTILLTYTSFLTFLLDLRIGERLGFGMALTLVVVAQQILTFELIPVSNMRLWIDKFVGWSFYWVLIGLLESVAIGFMWYLREDRVARKERKRISLMSPDARESMMDRAAANAAAALNGEEASPLTCSKFNDLDKNIVDNDENDVEADNGKDTYHQKVEAKTKQELSGENYFVFYFFNYSLRKLDFIMLAFTLSTYTVFILAMFATVHGDLWNRGDPEWYDSTSQFRVNSYKIDDPNA